MDNPQINPMLKSALEFGPILGFFVAYLWLKDEVFAIGGTDYEGFIVVTAGFIPVFLASIGALWWLTGHLSRMQLVTAVLIVVFGGLSVWLNDERFFKIKPTLIYLLFGGLLGFGLMRGQSYLRVVMEGLMPLREEGWMILTKRVTGLFFGLALLNELVWRSMSTEVWVYFKTFGLTAAIFLFFIFQGGLFKRYGLEPEDE
ncbi:MAG: inner membrane-spanning protein YciB [Paracoccaceae bacterium]|nr:inner membrane-spanning protein YciB [Paracoccaceae bacterium]